MIKCKECKHWKKSDCSENNQMESLKLGICNNEKFINITHSSTEAIVSKDCNECMIYWGGGEKDSPNDFVLFRTNENFGCIHGQWDIPRNDNVVPDKDGLYEVVLFDSLDSRYRYNLDSIIAYVNTNDAFGKTLLEGCLYGTVLTKQFKNINDYLNISISEVAYRIKTLRTLRMSDRRLLIIGKIEPYGPYKDELIKHFKESKSFIPCMRSLCVMTPDLPNILNKIISFDWNNYENNIELFPIENNCDH